MKSETKLKILATVAVVLIPLLLIVNAYQSKRYARLLKELDSLELKQQELVEKNRKLISDISLMSSSERIEKIAESELGMHKAKSEDIVRVEIK